MDNPEELLFEEPAFFEITPDLVCIAGKEGFFKKVNPAVISKLGYTEAELMVNPISYFIHPEDKPLTQRKREELLNGKPLVNFQNRYITKQGQIVWLEWTSIYLADRQVVFAIAKDISERKKIEIEIDQKYKKFRSLTSHFKSSIEEDRKYLASELHEELAQLASVLKTDLEWITLNKPDWDPSSKNKVEHALGISKLLIRTIRRISFSISPNMLEHIGLNATLEWHCKEFSILNGIPCSFEGAYDEKTLTHEEKVDLFRICQEALTNIFLHAQANHVSIAVKTAGDPIHSRIQMIIEDDGKGFVVDQQKQRPGFIRMRERAASINGQLTVESRVGQGTRVCLTIPSGPSV